MEYNEIIIKLIQYFYDGISIPKKSLTLQKEKKKYWQGFKYRPTTAIYAVQH